jgi:hypothetical protein
MRFRLLIPRGCKKGCERFYLARMALQRNPAAAVEVSLSYAAEDVQ